MAVFTLGRMPASGNRRQVAEDTVTRLADFLGDRQMTYREAAKAMGVSPNSLRYATLTGRVVLRWEGSGKPIIRVVNSPRMSEQEARRELVRRYLHVFGPANAESFSQWAGVTAKQAQATFADLRAELTSVVTPMGIRLILTEDHPALTAEPEPTAAVRLLPSGDTFYLLQGADRELLIADEERRSELWTSRVWPGAVLIDGEVVGTWRRNKGNVTISTWRSLSKRECEAVEAEASSFPLQERRIALSWD